MPIPGTTRLERLKENLAATTLMFTAEDLANIEDRLAQVEIAGGRYAERAQRMIDS